MSKKRTKKTDSIPGQHWREYAAVAVLIVAVLSAIALFTYDADDVLSTRSSTRYENAIGIVGAYVSVGLFHAFGVAAYAFPVFLIALALMVFFHVSFPSWKILLARAITIGLLVIFGACLADIAHNKTVEFLQIPSAGGIVGSFLNEGLIVRFCGRIGAIVILTGLSIIAILFLLDMSVRSLGDGVRTLSYAFSAIGSIFAALFRGIAHALRTVFTWCHIRIRTFITRITHRRKKKAAQKPVVVVTRPASPRKKKEEKAPERDTVELPEEVAKAVPASPSPKEQPRPAAEKSKETDTSIYDPSDEDEDAPPYEIPSTDLLDEPVIGDTAEIEQAAADAAIKLAKTLENFGIDAQMGQSICGPVITCHEVHPAPGVKVRSITNLENELAMSMKAKSIRIVAPIPGKDAVGIELPNARRRMVTFSELVNSEEYDNAVKDMSLPFAVGQTLSGEVFVDDIAEMPHLLVAGATGSGKSVCINTLLMSLLLRFDIDSLRLVLVDPKHVELVPYKDIPHLLVPVLNEPGKVPDALEWLIGEMERRYKFFARLGVRNISMYNTKREKNDEPLSIMMGGTEYDLPLSLPYIVVVVDELADLMMVAADEVEKRIIRLAQLARAAGIHMVLATQRPSANVITGLIKANIPARIGFRTTSGIDSKVIIDETGTQKLLGKGDMLYKSPAMARTMRLQGAFVSEDEVRRITSFIREQRKPNYVDVGSVSDDSDVPELEMDEKFDDAIATVLDSGQASASYLQRRLQVGYARAARLIDLMEAHGILGPKRGSKPREILVEEWPPSNDEE